MADILYEHGMVLGVDLYAEADKRFSILTEASEKIKSIARGSAKISSKLGMHLLIGDEVTIGCVEGKSMLVMVSAEMLNRFSQCTSPAAREKILRLCGWVDGFLIEHDPHPGLFQEIKDIFSALQKSSDEIEILGLYVRGVLRILQQAGLSPQLSRCLMCAQTPVAISFLGGGGMCSRHKTPQDFPVSSETFLWLQSLQGNEKEISGANLQTAQEAQVVMERYADTMLEGLSR